MKPEPVMHLEPYDAWALVRDHHHHSKGAGTYISAVGSHFYARTHSNSEEPVEVRVTEVEDDCEEATHWGWVGRSRKGVWETTASMIWHEYVLFDMCFGGDPEKYAEDGQGRIVRLKVEVK